REPCCITDIRSVVRTDADVIAERSTAGRGSQGTGGRDAPEHGRAGSNTGTNAPAGKRTEPTPPRTGSGEVPLQCVDGQHTGSHIFQGSRKPVYSGEQVPRHPFRKRPRRSHRQV